jgi:hypothetical protein
MIADYLCPDLGCGGCMGSTANEKRDGKVKLKQKSWN